ncbi:MAG TPA: hypothetical protein VM940_02600 [Chthoniobacterales bacterium]|jgi:hypothetical protein|nr:hypothetical protein [Chthoniobacterales bacterium]
MRSRVATIIALCAGVLFGGCVRDQYRSDSQRAYITPWTHLSASDREQVLQAFSRASRQPIIGITTHESKGRFPQLTIISGFDEPSEVNPWREYLLEKWPDGWHILGSSPIGQFISGLILSKPPPSLRDQKKT